MSKTVITGRDTIVKTRGRIYIIVTAFCLFLVFLIGNLIKLQIFAHDYYKEKVYDQITTTAPLKAERGKIYDSAMNVLATTKTVWRVFISTRDIKKAEKETKKNYTEIISSGLSSILDISSSELQEKIKKTNRLDVTVKKEIEEKEYLILSTFIKENDLENLVFLEAQNSRYYPEGPLLSHVLGFTGSDNQGLYGLEYYYDNYLSGTDGYYLYAKDANGNALDNEYATYVEAIPGASLVTTIDSYVQSLLENQINLAVKNHGVQNRATGIVMDIHSGAIIAMATSSPFDPNDPYTLDETSLQKLQSSGYEKGSPEYTAYKKELLEVMWSNKAVSETYEPGSTFKIITVSSALDSKTSKENDLFSCVGYHNVGGYRIRCHKAGGHGSGFTLAYGLQMSCNPTMMQIAERIGNEAFYDYIEKFGYFKKSGIDLPSEASTIFHSKENIGSTELATISFGQRFKVSIINHLKAIATVANGGSEITPYIVEKIIDCDGNSIYTHPVCEKKQIIDEEVAAAVNRILEEGVSGNGGAKNAAVNGYKIAAKTGTSQKFDILDENGNSYLRIGSTVGYNISENGGIAVIIVVDEPTSEVKYGSIVAAPYVSAFLEDALPYLGYESSAHEDSVSVPSLIGKTVSEAKSILNEMEIDFEIVGTGETVLSQTPTSFDTLYPSLTKIVLCTDEQSQFVSVPSLIGKELSVAVSEAVGAGLNIKISGAGGGSVIYQSLPFGATVKKGSVIELKTLVIDYED